MSRVESCALDGKALVAKFKKGITNRDLQNESKSTYSIDFSVAILFVLYYDI